MSSGKLKNIDRFIDRHGKPRRYFRCGRGKRVRLPGEPGSAEFMAAYLAATASAGVSELEGELPPIDLDKSGSRP